MYLLRLPQSLLLHTRPGRPRYYLLPRLPGTVDDHPLVALGVRDDLLLLLHQLHPLLLEKHLLLLRRQARGRLRQPLHHLVLLVLLPLLEYERALRRLHLLQLLPRDDHLLPGASLGSGLGDRYATYSHLGPHLRKSQTYIFNFLLFLTHVHELFNKVRWHGH
jgi:hypothetical protein